ncbi:MAG: rhodanese-like domain-containing protein [Acidimicrobiales bacterium]
MTILEVPTADYESALTPGAQLIDVRQPDEFASGSLPGARNLPLGDLAARAGELDPSRRVVLLCRSGARSGRAAEYLESIGFGDVVNLSGGMMAAAA